MRISARAPPWPLSSTSIYSIHRNQDAASLKCALNRISCVRPRSCLTIISAPACKTPASSFQHSESFAYCLSFCFTEYIVAPSSLCSLEPWFRSSSATLQCVETLNIGLKCRLQLRCWRCCAQGCLVWCTRRWGRSSENVTLRVHRLGECHGTPIFWHTFGVPRTLHTERHVHGTPILCTWHTHIMYLAHPYYGTIYTSMALGRGCLRRSRR